MSQRQIEIRYLRTKMRDTEPRRETEMKLVALSKQLQQEREKRERAYK